jgi:hypothetical protein
MKELIVKIPDYLKEFIPRFLVSTTEDHKIVVVPLDIVQTPRNPYYCAAIVSQIIGHYTRGDNTEQHLEFMNKFNEMLPLVLKEVAEYTKEISRLEDNA